MMSAIRDRRCFRTGRIAARGCSTVVHGPESGIRRETRPPSWGGKRALSRHGIGHPDRRAAHAGPLIIRFRRRRPRGSADYVFPQQVGGSHADLISRRRGRRHGVVPPRRSAGRRILVDCGMFQGSHELHEENAAPFGFDASSIDFLLLTHAHLDHCGRIPLLVKRGFRGEIIATAATRDLARLVLLDSAHLHEEEAKRRRRHGASGKRTGTALRHGGRADAMGLFGRTAGYGNGRSGPWRQRQLLRRGAYPGFGEHTAGTDRGRRTAAHPVFRRYRAQGTSASEPAGTPSAPTSWSWKAPMAIATTGPSTHPSTSLQAAKREAERGGNIIIPTFALERAQELLFFLREGMASGATCRREPAGLPRFPHGDFGDAALRPPSRGAEARGGQP